MRSRGGGRTIPAVLTGVLTGVLASGLVACSADHGPPEQPSEASPTAAPVTSYDDTLEPAAAVLALVPADATAVAVTDFDRVRLELDASELTGESPAGKRAKFWRRADRLAPLLTTGLLRPDEKRLANRFGFTQDDVAWEARFISPSGQGWVVHLRDDLDLTGVQAAIAAGVDALAGGTLDAEHHLVTSGTTEDPATSWASRPDLTSLVGAPATATYVAAECLPFEVAFGSDVEGDLAPAPAEVLSALAPLGAYSVSLGASLGTVRLGAPRGDAFERARLAEVMPATDPEFGEGYADPVADPATGRIGYRLADPALAARLALARHLPFAVCDG